VAAIALFLCLFHKLFHRSIVPFVFTMFVICIPLTLRYYLFLRFYYAATVKMSELTSAQTELYAHRNAIFEAMMDGKVTKEQLQQLIPAHVIKAIDAGWDVRLQPDGEFCITPVEEGTDIDVCGLIVPTLMPTELPAEFAEELPHGPGCTSRHLETHSNCLRLRPSAAARKLYLQRVLQPRRAAGAHTKYRVELFRYIQMVSRTKFGNSSSCLAHEVWPEDINDKGRLRSRNHHGHRLSSWVTLPSWRKLNDLDFRGGHTWKDPITRTRYLQYMGKELKHIHVPWRPSHKRSRQGSTTSP
jgi:hypothetical protein